jgi:hypothetical protein
MQGQEPFLREEHIHRPLQEEHSHPYLGCRQAACRQERRLEESPDNRLQRVPVER